LDKPNVCDWKHRLKLLLKSHLVVEVHEEKDANVIYKIPCLLMNKYAESIDSKNDHEQTHRKIVAFFAREMALLIEH
jgi:hypothetical protein